MNNQGYNLNDPNMNNNPGQVIPGSYENNQFNNNYQNQNIQNNPNIQNNDNNKEEDNSMYGNKKINSGMDNNLQELLKSQQSLYDKYSSQLSNIKKVQTPSVFDDIDNLINPTNNKNNQNVENTLPKENNNNPQNTGEDKIITQKIKMNLPMENNSMIIPSSNKQKENIGLNDEKINNTLTKDVNDIVEKYNLSGSGKSGRDSNSDFANDNTNFEKKKSAEVKNSMNIFDQILQENAIDLKDVDKDQEISKGNSPDKSDKINGDLLDNENLIDSIVVEVDDSKNTTEEKKVEEAEEKKVEEAEEIKEKKDEEEVHENEEVEEIENEKKKGKKGKKRKNK
jgi:hypothetical protein